MRKKFDWNAPFTKKEYGILCVVVWIISLLIYAAMLIYIYKEAVLDWCSKHIEQIKTRFKRDENVEEE